MNDLLPGGGVFSGASFYYKSQFNSGELNLRWTKRYGGDALIYDSCQGWRQEAEDGMGHRHRPGWNPLLGMGLLLTDTGYEGIASLASARSPGWVPGYRSPSSSAVRSITYSRATARFTVGPVKFSTYNRYSWMAFRASSRVNEPHYIQTCTELTPLELHMRLIGVTTSLLQNTCVKRLIVWGLIFFLSIPVTVLKGMAFTPDEDKRLSALMKSAQDGDKNAYSGLLRAVEGLLKSFLQRRMGATPAVDDLTHSNNPTVAPLAHVGEAHLRITARADSESALNELMQPVERECYGIPFGKQSFVV